MPLLVDDPNMVYDGLTDLVNKRQLCFCDEVVVELERIARREYPLTWAKGIAGNRTNRGAGYGSAVWVGHDFSSIVDPTAKASAESAALYVVAQAVELDKAADVTVVTEDLKEKPTRSCVRQACEHFNIRWLGLVEFLIEVDLVEVVDDEWDDG